MISMRLERLYFRLLNIALTAGMLPVLSACQPIANMAAAPDAHNPACASVMLLLPEHIGEHAQQETNAQATSAWGNPTAVELRCGVDLLPPTTDRCLAVDGVDWIIRKSDESWIFTTYGRDPAVEVTLRGDTVGSATLLGSFSPIIQQIKPYTSCVSLEENQATSRRQQAFVTYFSNAKAISSSISSE